MCKAFSYGNAAVATTDVLDADATGAAGQTIGNGALTVNGVSIDGNGANTTMTDLVANINAKTGETASPPLSKPVPRPTRAAWC